MVLLGTVGKKLDPTLNCSTLALICQSIPPYDEKWVLTAYAVANQCGLRQSDMHVPLSFINASIIS